MSIKKDKIKFLFLLLTTLTLLKCSSFPSSEKQLAKKVFHSFKNKDFSLLWNMCMQNPSVRKNSLIKLLRAGRITNKVYQSDMGRVIHLKKQEMKKLKQDYKRVLNLINNLKIKPVYNGITNRDKKKKYLTIKIGKPNHSVSINIHYDVVGSEYYLISLYSIK